MHSTAFGRRWGQFHTKTISNRKILWIWSSWRTVSTHWGSYSASLPWLESHFNLPTNGFYSISIMRERRFHFVSTKILYFSKSAYSFLSASFSPFQIPSELAWVTWINKWTRAQSRAFREYEGKSIFPVNWPLNQRQLASFSSIGQIYFFFSIPMGHPIRRVCLIGLISGYLCGSSGTHLAALFLRAKLSPFSFVIFECEWFFIEIKKKKRKTSRFHSPRNIQNFQES